MIRIAFTAGLLLAAAPALAGERIATDGKVPAHCTKQMVHTPAGKTVHNAPVLFCKDIARTEPTAAAVPVRAPAEIVAARD